MKLLSWNIQWGLGVDGRVDLERIANEIRRLGEPDVICLQEVTAGFDDLKANDGADQFDLLARAFPQHCAIMAPAVDFAGSGGRRRLFGNLLLSRYAVATVERHTLPWLTISGHECMPRGLVIATVETPGGPLRIMTTHLEWSSMALRQPQVDAIRSLHHAASLRMAVPAAAGKGGYAPQPLSRSAVLVGDFNMRPREPTRQRLMAAFEAPLTHRFIDSFEVRHPGEAHPISMCLFDQSDGPARCLDYAFCTEDLVSRIVEITYDQTSAASDHQPIVLELDGL